MKALWTTELWGYAVDNTFCRHLGHEAADRKDFQIDGKDVTSTYCGRCGIHYVVFNGAYTPTTDQIITISRPSTDAVSYKKGDVIQGTIKASSAPPRQRH